MLPISAQQMRIGYFSYNAVLKATPEYVSAKANIENLRKQYDSEIQFAEKDFNDSSIFLAIESRRAKNCSRLTGGLAIES